ncbi:hypothetical protein HdK1rev_00084 [Escherichia phage vB_EcoS_HdK1]|nr:hypothetical protein HdK1rev_00084 [Escherichia phage vB_EcoS_HdK1]
MLLYSRALCLVLQAVKAKGISLISFIQLMSEMSEINESDGFQMLELTEEDFSNDPYAMEDQDVYIQLCEQENGTLFKQLWEGRWRAEEVDTSNR